MYEYFRNYRKTLTKMIKHAKSKFYSNKFENCKGDMKKTWGIINDIRGKKKRDIKPVFEIDNKRITNRRVIPYEFNKYFVSIAEKMNSNSEEINGLNIQNAKIPNFADYMDRSQVSSIFMHDCTCEEVENIFSDLENGKASDIPIKLIKKSSHVISPILTDYYNILMNAGKFPNDLKVGKLLPFIRKVMKKNSKITGQFPHCLYLAKYLRRLYILDFIVI